MDRAGAGLSAVLKSKQGKQSNSGDVWVVVNVFNKVLLVMKRTVCFVRGVFNAWQQVKESREVTTVSRTMNMGKMLFGQCDSFNKYAVLAKVCKLRYFK